MKHDDYLKHLTPDLRDIPEGQLNDIGKTLATKATTAAGRSTAQYSIPFGEVVTEALKRYPKWDWKDHGHNRKPTRKEYLEFLFKVSARWCYQCAKAFGIVMAGDWEAFHDNHLIPAEGRPSVNITVDLIVSKHREWMKGPSQKSKKPTLKEQLKALEEKYSTLEENETYETMRADLAEERFAELKEAIEEADHLDQVKITLAQWERPEE